MRTAPTSGSAASAIASVASRVSPSMPSSLVPLPSLGQPVRGQEQGVARIQAAGQGAVLRAALDAERQAGTRHGLRRPIPPEYQRGVRARVREDGLACSHVHQAQGRHDEAGAGLSPEVVELAQKVVESHQSPGRVGDLQKKRAQGVLDFRRPRGGLQPFPRHIADHERDLARPDGESVVEVPPTSASLQAASYKGATVRPGKACSPTWIAGALQGLGDLLFVRVGRVQQRLGPGLGGHDARLIPHKPPEFQLPHDLACEDLQHVPLLVREFPGHVVQHAKNPTHARRTFSGARPRRSAGGGPL